MKKVLLLICLLIAGISYSQDTIIDCFGTPSPQGWIGDGFCDDGSYTWNGTPIDFNCEEFGYDAGDCEIPIDESAVLGCTDIESPNFNPWATLDDGSCVVSECSSGFSLIKISLTLDQFPSETGLIVTDISNGEYIENIPAGTFNYNQSNQTIIYDLCVPETGVEIILSDTYGDGLAGSLYNGGSDGDLIIYGDYPCGNGPDVFFDLDTANFGSVVYSGPLWIPACGVEAIPGCLDADYIEFNPSANIDNGSCETLHTLGCINPNAFNYNPQATLNEIVPQCEYTLVLEDDGGDGWGSSYIGISQGNDIIGEFSVEPGLYEKEFTLQLHTDQPIKVFYFQVVGPQQPIQEASFQTMHNSFRLINSNDNVTLQGGVFPFSFNGQGALQPYGPPFWTIYEAMPFCGDYCIPTVYGCLDEQSLNYDSLANTDDASCIEIVEGCTSPFAFNYDSLANVDNGSCVAVVVGCMDEIAWNYNFAANTEDGSCLYFGCMDTLADNYDPIANVDNGSCFITVLGCTDPEAFNYNEEANTEDVSCIPFIYGCMDSTAFNYNPLAKSEDECELIVEGCMDASAYNYDVFANTESECLYDAGCVGEPGDPYWLNDTCYAWVIMVDPYCCNTNWDEKCQQLYWSCSDDSPLDTRDLLRGHNIVMYPNPMGDVLNILTNGPVDIEVYDVSGKLVIKVKENHTTKGLNQLDVSLLPAGVYNFSVTYDGNTSTTKVLKR